MNNSSTNAVPKSLLAIVQQEIAVLQTIVDITQEMIGHMNEDAVDSAAMCMSKRERSLKQLQEWEERANSIEVVQTGEHDTVSEAQALQEAYEQRKQVYEKAVELDIEVRERAAAKLEEYRQTLRDTSEGRRAFQEYDGYIEDTEGYLLDEQK